MKFVACLPPRPTTAAVFVMHGTKNMHTSKSEKEQFSSPTTDQFFQVPHNPQNTDGKVEVLFAFHILVGRLHGQPPDQRRTRRHTYFWLPIYFIYIIYFISNHERDWCPLAGTKKHVVSGTWCLQTDWRCMALLETPHLFVRYRPNECSLTVVVWSLLLWIIVLTSRLLYRMQRFNNID